jgi:two-component system, OmpR family, sensor histidine kinase KdpD
VQDLVHAAGNISVQFIAGDELQGRSPNAVKKTLETRRKQLDIRPYGFAFFATAAALGVSELISSLGVENVDLVFLTAIVAVAVRHGLWPSLFACVVSALCYAFFFLPPIYTFTISDPTNVAAFAFFVIMATLVSNVAARVRVMAETAMDRARTTDALYTFSRKLAGVGTLEDVSSATTYQIALMLRMRVLILLPEQGTLIVKGSYPPEEVLPEADVAAAKWAWEHVGIAGRESATMPEVKRLFLPMRTGRGAVGVIGINSDNHGPLLSPDERRLLDALMDQSALAIERIRLVEEQAALAPDRSVPDGLIEDRQIAEPLPPSPR